jgi:hypothetical protein
MAKDNGHLTKANQRQLHRRENRISKSIYKDKHNNKKLAANEKARDPRLRAPGLSNSSSKRQAYKLNSYRFPTSSQFTTFHQAPKYSARRF